MRHLPKTDREREHQTNIGLTESLRAGGGPFLPLLGFLGFYQREKEKERIILLLRLFSSFLHQIIEY